MSILRFEPILRNDECCGPDFIETQEGACVDYFDHVSAIAAKDAENARLERIILARDYVIAQLTATSDGVVKENSRLRKVVEAATVVADDCDLDLFEERGVCRVKSYKLKALVDALAELDEISKK